MSSPQSSNISIYHTPPEKRKSPPPSRAKRVKNIEVLAVEDLAKSKKNAPKSKPAVSLPVVLYYIFKKEWTIKIVFDSSVINCRMQLISFLNFLFNHFYKGLTPFFRLKLKRPLRLELQLKVKVDLLKQGLYHH